MKRLRNYLIGVEQGQKILFADFEHGGPMWTGSGPRIARAEIAFSEPFRQPPVVHAGLAMWDIDRDSNQRADISTEAVTETGFQLVFRTWGDTQVARVRASWLAIGELAHDDDWHL
ncbi:H-type lectin domain-containing protein [Tropicimonas marinistellae]|uniref:H-type lectin domain-containing protein n=1 Tax=Tropicimonas marinistellae TaxID=1739787 RepID=UPI00083288F4|nr:H-type lectin domain-containing protein [Tropicimonas marinistellae]